MTIVKLNLAKRENTLKTASTILKDIIEIYLPVGSTKQAYYLELCDNLKEVRGEY